MKKFLSVILSFLIIFIFSVSTLATKNFANYSYFPTANTNLAFEGNQTQLRMPNGIPIRVIPKLDGTGVKVKVGNLGVDGLDSVMVNVTATGYSYSLSSGPSYVPPIIGKTFDFNFPYILCDTTYNVIVTVIDGSGTKRLTGEGKLTWNEEGLKNANWHNGSFSTRASSLEYHFSKHGSEVGATNLIEYLNYANMYRDKVLYDIKNNNYSEYNITNGNGYTPAKKYKHKTNRQYIILSNSNQLILSYGR